MSSDQSLTDQWKDFQNEFNKFNQELMEQMKRSSELLFSGNGIDSLSILISTLKNSEKFFEYWKRWMDGHAIGNSKEWWKEQEIQTRVSLLWGIGQAEEVLNKYGEAQKDYEDALSLLGDKLDPSHGSLLQALGGVYELEEKFEEAKNNYLKASDLFKSLAGTLAQGDPEGRMMRDRFLEEAVRSLSYAACNALNQDKRDEFLEYMNSSIDSARKYGLSTLEVKLRMRRDSYLFTSDPTGKVMDNLVRDYGKGLKTLEDLARRDYLISKDIDFVIDVILFQAEYHIEMGVRSKSDMTMKKAEPLILLARDIARGKYQTSETAAAVRDWARFLSEQEVTKKNAEKEWKALMGLTWLYGSLGEFYQSLGLADRAQEQDRKATSCAQEALKIAKTTNFSPLQVEALQALIPLLSNPEELKRARKKMGRLMR